MSSAYNMILGRSIVNDFQVVISTYHMKLKLPARTKVGEVIDNQYATQKCYVEAIRRGRGKMDADPPNRENGRRPVQCDNQGAAIPPHGQPAKELLSIQLIHRELDKITKISSELSPTQARKLTTFLQENTDVFAWSIATMASTPTNFLSNPPPREKRHF
ncbi:UNVERIFIED_CONTAM: hypothetical protein Sradi_2966300 [Sesamum radiatum]|uniref:Uncharacterized protein n=1 Tax=Sesamum radiatum TaxID=300843 RepID=A0AAW2RZP3_SESRA